MRELVIIETRDAADHKDPARMADLAIGMARTGEDAVTTAGAGTAAGFAVATTGAGSGCGTGFASATTSA